MDAAARLRPFLLGDARFRDAGGYAERNTDRSGDSMLSWIALTLSMGPANLWSYSCDHFLYGACMRVPTGMSVTYEAPVDFGLHRIRHEGREVALIYEGDAPEKPASGSTPDLRFADGGYVVSGYARAEGGSTRYDVYVRPGSSGAGSLHIRGSAATSDELASLAAVVGGLRICNFQQSKRSQTLTCPRHAEWGPRLSEWVMRSSTSGKSN